MIEIIVLGLIIFALIGYIAWRESLYQEQTKMLVRAIKASSLGELIYAEKDETEKEPTSPDIISMEQMTNEEFLKHLHTSQEEKEEVESVK